MKAEQPGFCGMMLETERSFYLHVIMQNQPGQPRHQERGEAKVDGYLMPPG